jgi:hypothetical protein
MRIGVRSLIFPQLFLLLAAGMPAMADDYTDAPCTKPTAVAFAHGATSAKYKGGFERNEMDCWTVIAKQGQTLGVKIEAIDKNASFDIYLPQYRILKSDAGLDIKGKRLTPGGTGDRHITSWAGTLPASGRYLINVVSEGGNVTYDLSVSVAAAK